MEDPPESGGGGEGGGDDIIEIWRPCTDMEYAGLYWAKSTLTLFRSGGRFTPFPYRFRDFLLVKDALTNEFFKTPFFQYLGDIPSSPGTDVYDNGAIWQPSTPPNPEDFSPGTIEERMWGFTEQGEKMRLPLATKELPLRENIGVKEAIDAEERKDSERRFRENYPEEANRQDLGLQRLHEYNANAVNGNFARMARARALNSQVSGSGSGTTQRTRASHLLNSQDTRTTSTATTSRRSQSLGPSTLPSDSNATNSNGSGSSNPMDDTSSSNNEAGSGMGRVNNNAPQPNDGAGRIVSPERIAIMVVCNNLSTATSFLTNPRETISSAQVMNHSDAATAAEIRTQLNHAISAMEDTSRPDNCRIVLQRISYRLIATSPTDAAAARRRAQSTEQMRRSSTSSVAAETNPAATRGARAPSASIGDHDADTDPPAPPLISNRLIYQQQQQHLQRGDDEFSEFEVGTDSDDNPIENKDSSSEAPDDEDGMGIVTADAAQATATAVVDTRRSAMIRQLDDYYKKNGKECFLHIPNSGDDAEQEDNGNSVASSEDEGGGGANTATASGAATVPGLDVLAAAAASIRKRKRGRKAKAKKEDANVHLHQCASCDKMIPYIFRFCMRCFKIRRNWLPPRPPTKKRKLKLMNASTTNNADKEEEQEALLEQDSGNVENEISDLENSEESPISPSSSGISSEASSLCNICFLAQKDAAFVHNKIAHFCCCYKCGDKVLKKHGSCPICRQKVIRLVKVVDI